MRPQTAALATLGGVGLLLLGLWGFLGSNRGPDLTASLAKIDTVKTVVVKSEVDVAAITAEIRGLRQEAAARERAALQRYARADETARESVELRARVGRLEEQWANRIDPRTLIEARQQLSLAADLIEQQKDLLGASAREILDLRAAIQELTAATHAQDIALAKADTRDEMRKETLAMVMSVLEGIRADLKEERAERARARWWGLVPVIGTIVLAFGLHVMAP